MQQWAAFVVAIIVLGPLSKAIAWRIRSSGGPPDQGLVQQLRRELEATEARAQEGDRRMAQLEERLDFMENLLREPKRAEQLPPRTGA